VHCMNNSSVAPGPFAVVLIHVNLPICHRRVRMSERRQKQLGIKVPLGKGKCKARGT